MKGETNHWYTPMMNDDDVMVIGLSVTLRESTFSLCNMLW
jgi:hypothetical protein